ncbi:cytochrome c [Anianabacter salinae]|uniref:cytochrome c n=1 Tax=Anianabacter salinae TaxID=2851023 RepID=UPI00225DF53C|nr:cytochrome c [Anianabacter salinae]MBV0912109.1 cytochrome c [Anianabacter salinae]
MRRALVALCVLAVLGLGVFWIVTAPKSANATALAGIEPDVARGEWVFNASGCASCHSAPEAAGEAKLELAGGQAFATDFGTFYAPNISPSEAGIGGWSALDLVNAVQNGVSPSGDHYYPAFPYTSYARAETSDIVSLHAYMQTLPAIDTPSRPHDVGFPFNIRRSLGGWKLLFARDGWVLDGVLTQDQARGRYLAEALGHCGECHTARNALGGPDMAAWLGGAPNPTGRGTIPNITPGGLDWSEGEIAEYLSSGFTPEFDTVGGHMVAVVDNFAKLDAADRAAVAAYLKAVPAVGGE